MSTGVWTRMRAAWIAARRAFADPTQLTDVRPATLDDRAALYLERWAWAQSGAFDDLAAWAQRISQYGLYERTRGYYNPAGRLAEFYASQVYPGYVPQGDGVAPGGVREALPLAPGTAPEIVAAVRQIAQWGNVQTLKDVIPYRGAALGDAGLLEIVDDDESGKCRFRLWWPGYVKDLNLSPYGDVRGYALEYQAYDRERKEEYTYREEVDREEIRYFRNSEPYAPLGDGETVRPNPYGFVPACWVRHVDNGSPWGEPAMRGTGKVELLNSFVSRTLDYLKVRYKAPFGIAGEFDQRGLGTLDQASVRRAAVAADADVADEFSDIVGGGDTDEVFLLALPDGATGVPLFGSIDPWQSVEVIDRLFGEIENDNPELSAWTEIRKMSQVSGVAIERALGDTQGRLFRAQATYDQQLVKAFQMATAIAGWRVGSGSWGTGPLTAAQEKFRPFGLESYAAGDLDLSLLPRPLAPPSAEEAYAAKSAKYGAISAGKAAGVPARDVLVECGYSEEDADRIAGEQEAAAARQLGTMLEQRMAQMRPLGGRPEPRQLPPAGGEQG
jgi:hypothetical protein